MGYLCRVRFETMPAEPGDRFGGRSWHYRLQESTLTASLDDYPFGGWHELTTCYGARDWVEQTRQTLWHPNHPGNQFVAAQLPQAFGGRVWLSPLFQIRDESSRVRQPPPDSFWSRTAARFAQAWPWHGIARDETVMPGETTPSYQLQMFVESPEPLRRPGRRNRPALFEQFQSIVPHP